MLEKFKFINGSLYDPLRLTFGQICHLDFGTFKTKIWVYKILC